MLWTAYRENCFINPCTDGEYCRVDFQDTNALFLCYMLRYRRMLYQWIRTHFFAAFRRGCCNDSCWLGKYEPLADDMGMKALLYVVEYGLAV